MITKTEDCMTNTQTHLSKFYAAFSDQNIDGALALISENVNWPESIRRRT